MRKSSKNQRKTTLHQAPKKRRRFKRTLTTICLVLLLLGGGAFAYGWNFLKNIESQTYEEIEDITVSDEILEGKKDHSVINIALFGVDSRVDSYEGTRSDAMMVLSYNPDLKSVTISSVVRDTYAFIDQDHGYQKINHAYAYGGPSLAIQTINQNFDLDIQKYVTVNFNVVQAFIDKIGGIEVDIQDYEINEINRVILEMQTEGVFQTAPTLSHTGVQTLNGQQAVAYMRIRKVGNGDFERMERQRRIINQVMEKALSMSKFKLVGLVNEVVPYIKTNLTVNEIIDLGTQVLTSGLDEINQLQLPNVEMSWGGRLSDGVYYLVPRTLKDNIVWWHQEVYGVEDYELSSLATRINDQIPRYSGIY